MSVLLNLTEQLRAIEPRQVQDRQYLAHDIRDFALILASQGKFEEALHIIHWTRLEGFENVTLWSDFYFGVAKVILARKNCNEAALAFKYQESHVKFLENVILRFQEPDASKLREFLRFKDKII
jgi:hypothetical protein